METELNVKYNTNLETAFRALPEEMREHSERIGYNAHILYKEMMSEGLYADDPDAKASYLHLIYEAVMYFSVGHIGRTIPHPQYSGHVALGTYMAEAEMEKAIRKSAKAEDRAFLKLTRDIIHSHHEQWNGDGYPDKLAKEEIPLLARLTSVCNAFDTLTSHRGDVPAISKDRALMRLKLELDNAYDAELVRLLDRHRDQMAVEGDEFKRLDQYKAEQKIVQKAKKAALDGYKYTRGQLRSIEVLFIPVVNADTGDHCFYDTEIRINDRYQGVVNPDLVFPMAERTGQICEITEIALQQVLDMIILMENKFKKVGRVCLQVRETHLAKKNFLAKTVKMVENAGLTPDRLIIEISEATAGAIGPDSVQVIEDLRALGVKIAIGNFGMQYLSIAKLNKFPYDILKPDKNLIYDIAESEKTQAVYEAAINTARKPSTQIVAVNVETNEQRDALIHLGCKIMEGPLFGGVQTVYELVEH